MHRQAASVSSMPIPPGISQEMPVHSSGRAGPTLPSMQQTHAGQSEPLHRFWQSSDQALATPQSMSAHYSDPSYVRSSGGTGAYEPAAMHSHQPRQRSEPSRVQASRGRQKPYAQKGRLPKSDPYPAKQAAMPSGLSGSLQPYQGYGNPFGGLTTVSAAMLQSTSAHYRFPHQSAFVGQSHGRNTAVASATVTSSASQPLVASSESQGAVFSPPEPEIKKAKIATLDTGVSVTKPVETDLSIVGTASLTAASRGKVINETCDTLDGIRNLMFESLQRLYNIPKKDAENVFFERVLKKQASQVSQSGNISGIPVATTSDQEAGDPSSGSTSWIERSSQLGLSRWEGAPCFEGEADTAPTTLRSLDVGIYTARDESSTALKVPAQQEFQRSLSYPGAESTLGKKRRRRMELEEEKKRLESEASNTSMSLHIQNVSRESELPLIQPSQNLPSLGLSQPFSVLSLEEEKRGLIQAELSTVEDKSATAKKGKGKSKKGKGKKSAKKQSLESLMPEGEKERLSVPAIVIRRPSAEEKYVDDTVASEKESRSSGQHGQASFSVAGGSEESPMLRGILEKRTEPATYTEKDRLLKGLLGESGEGQSSSILATLQADSDSFLKEQSGAALSHQAPQHLSRAGMRGRAEHSDSSVGNLDILARACETIYEPDVSSVSSSGSEKLQIDESK
ncbi:hypothetical protein [Kistimonas asteriae]|uniref:hypothetical protein n=1 Tax=Kistimonas asteriae TaxID=517724 RepID=UPI001BAC235B|nr:hypothetical protein [Kistimonas asteriae]